MGCCASGKKPPMIRDLHRTVPSAAIYLEENFKLVDFSQKIKAFKTLLQIQGYFQLFHLSDIRCVRKVNDSKDVHSSLIAISSQILPNSAEEICLLIQYSPYGFSLTIGEEHAVLSSADLSDNSMEMIHLPASDSQRKAAFSDILEWVYEHKDELFMSPADSEELNMGKRLFKYILSLFHKQ